MSAQHFISRCLRHEMGVAALETRRRRVRSLPAEENTLEVLMIEDAFLQSNINVVRAFQ